MQRKILYSVFFALLVIITAVFIFINKKSSIRPDQMDFALEDPAMVDKITITNRMSRILLEKKQGTWYLNTKFMAGQETVNMFLQALGRIEVLAPASKSIRDTIIRKLDEKGIQLALYRGNRILKDLSIYNDEGPVPGTYMMDMRLRKPYRVGLTGYKGTNIENLFSPKEASWRDNILFGYNPGNIAAVDIEYPGQPEQSFRLTIDEMQSARLYAPGKEIFTEAMDHEEIRDYLSFFSPVQYFLPEDAPDTARLQDPFVIITVTDRKQDVFRLRAFRYFSSGSENYDRDRYLAVIDNDPLPVLVKYSDTDPIMKGFSDFLKKW